MKRRIQHVVRAALGLTTGALILGVTSTTGCRSANFISTKEEVRIGKETAAEVEKRHRVLTGTADARRVAAIGERLIAHCQQREGVPYTVKALDVNEVNAVSLPGGPVYVYRGLLDLLGKDDQALACVIGHELGHIDARHSAKQMSQRLAANVGILILLKGKTAQDIGSLTTDLLSLSYSRDDEYEADHRGISYAHKAGYQATGLLSFFRKLKELEKGSQQDPELLRSHPYTEARLRRAEMIIQKQDYRYGR
ncbi:MAG: M48 family metalloprotease [Chthonomonadales bacterium]|nr:M48 family metalloprotease [Chthonomonadales bacterium]